MMKGENCIYINLPRVLRSDREGHAAHVYNRVPTTDPSPRDSARIHRLQHHGSQWFQPL